jgi:hypothetical protein
VTEAADAALCHANPELENEVERKGWRLPPDVLPPRDDLRQCLDVVVDAVVREMELHGLTLDVLNSLEVSRQRELVRACAALSTGGHERRSPYGTSTRA